MPIIEYTCVTCGNRFEKLQKAGAAQEVECPACHSTEVRKELSTFSSTGSSSSSGCASSG